MTVRVIEVPNDIKHRTTSCMGDIDTYWWIECPKCKKEVTVRPP